RTLRDRGVELAQVRQQRVGVRAQVGHDQVGQVHGDRELVRDVGQAARRAVERVGGAGQRGVGLGQRLPELRLLVGQVPQQRLQVEDELAQLLPPVASRQLPSDPIEVGDRVAQLRVAACQRGGDAAQVVEVLAAGGQAGVELVAAAGDAAAQLDDQGL